MRRSKRRLLMFFVGMIVSMLTLERIERERAIRTPSGWDRITGASLPLQTTSWNLTTSSWRVGPGTAWTSRSKHDQFYVRAELHPASTLRLSLSQYEGYPLWVLLDAVGNVSAIHNGKKSPCMGKIPPSKKATAIELKLDADGLMVSRNDNKMICPIDTEERMSPQIEVQGGIVSIYSIGRDRRTDGVPLSPLWWMSGLMGLCFLWMAAMDLVVGVVQRPLPRKESLPTSLEE